jgi:hypothetical protein
VAKKPRQLRLFDPNKLSSREIPAVGGLTDASRRYAESRGLSWSEPTARFNPRRAHATYLAYRDAQRQGGETPGIRESYAVMREHIGKQFDFLTKPEAEGGLGFSVEFTEHDPYPSAAAMAEDVANKRIKAMKTSSTGGHTYFTNEENDMFRAVHDVFGHAALGRNFSREGEEAAYLSHRQMFPPEAHAAVTSELRGQNAFLNYGPERDFPDQSPGTPLVGLPDWASSTKDFDKSGPRAPKPKQPKYEQGRLF